MTTLTVMPPANDLKALTTDDLRRELVRGLNLSAEALNHVAAVWHELEARGECLAEFRSGIGRNIPLIAAGRLAAEAVVAFIDRPATLKALEGLPLDRQRELAAGGSVHVLAPGSSQPVTTTLAAMPAAAVRLVFCGGIERSPDEQRAAVVVRPKANAEKGRTFRVQVDRLRRTVKVGNVSVPLESVLAALAESAAGVGITAEELKLAKDRGDGVAMASCPLTADEDDRLKAICKAKKADRGEMVRRAVVAMWML
jgi:hypothetical protein